MKKSFVLILGISLILFVIGLFVEVRAALTSEEIDALIESGVTVAILEDNGIFIYPYSNSGHVPFWGQGLMDGYFNLPGYDGSSAYYFPGGPEEIRSMTITKKGLEQLISSGKASNEQIENLYSNLGITTSGGSSASTHSFTIQTNSYNGSQYRVIGKNNATPVFQKKVGSEWVELEY